MALLVPRLPPRVTLIDVERALIESMGNVTVAAAALGVHPALLRRAVQAMPLLEDAVQEGVEQLLDLAEAEIHRGLESRAPRTRMSAAAFVLSNSPAAKRRGWGRSARPGRPAEVHWREDDEEIVLPDGFVLGRKVDEP